MPVENIVRTACQACHCECGVLVHVQDERVVRIEGDPEHPMNDGRACPKGLAYTQLVYHPDRLKYPLKRVGGRGEGKWQRISWDEALDTIASEIRRIRTQYGPLAFISSYGTGPRDSAAALTGLMYSLGFPNASYTDSHYCWGPGLLAERVTYGGFITGEVGPDYKNSNCILAWGANPIHSHPARGKDLMEGRKRGAKLIVVDPRFTALASKADIWLQIRPATDDALALGMLNVIINEGLYDKEFVANWCLGFEELQRRVQEYPPAKVAETTWLNADDVIRTARMYAITKPATLHRRVACEMQTNSVQSLRAMAILIAVTGNLDVEGGNVFPCYPAGFITHTGYYKAKEARPPAELEAKRLGAEEFPLLCGPESSLAGYHPPTVIKALLTGKPYPVKAWFAANNFLVALENSREVAEALKKLELFVVTEFFMTPTAELADIVLPATTWLERDGICDASYTNFIGARQKAIEPLGECRDELTVAFEILKKLGVKYLEPVFKDTTVESVDELYDFRLKQVGITFEDLKKKAYVIQPMAYKKYENEGFSTPSGKVELYSNIFKEFGYDPLPHYRETPESPISNPELAEKYPFILITGGRHIAYFHSANRQIPWLRELAPDPRVEIHPETARGLDINEGDWVWIETPRGNGRVKQKAKLTRGIHPRVVHCEAHWWFPERPGPEHGVWESNINVVVPNDPPYDPIAGSVPLRGLLCRIYKAKTS